MEHDASATKAEKREKKNRAKMAVSGRNLKRLAQHIAMRAPVDPRRAP
jgi:hypothetical protein